MKYLKPIIILIAGCFSIYRVYISKYHTFLFDTAVWTIFIIGGLVLFAWILYGDIKKYRIEKQIRNFGTTFLALGFIAIISAMKYNIVREFNKPTLIRVYYDGDFNGTAIDFKTDGTCILDDHCLGSSDFTYGTYAINGDRIVIDKKPTNVSVVETGTYIIKKEESGGTDSLKANLYLYPVGKNEVLNNEYLLDSEIRYRVVIDNRK